MWELMKLLSGKCHRTSLRNDKSALAQVMACCHQATSHYLSQCWPKSMSSPGLTRPQWVNTGKSLVEIHSLSIMHSHYHLVCWPDQGTLPHDIDLPELNSGHHKLNSGHNRMAQNHGGIYHVLTIYYKLWDFIFHQWYILSEYSITKLLWVIEPLWPC